MVAAIEERERRLVGAVRAMMDAMSQRHRLRLEIRGAVQGVGFRPYVYRLAREMSLGGWAANDTGGVIVEVEGAEEALQRFLTRLPAEKPSPASIGQMRATRLAAKNDRDFRIEPSERQGSRTVEVLPDLATCPSCLDEVRDPDNRRYGYPFTNCTECGPRFSIIRSLPYDRPRTTMKEFALCPACRSEYENPLDRRFHAQPNACPDCGPRLALWDAAGAELAVAADALRLAEQGLRRGDIVAVKGLGGFHLMADAASGATLQRLRERKLRREKPLALMVRDLEAARQLCRTDDEAEVLLTSPEAPVVLLPRRPGAAVHERVAPNNPYLGIMLAYTPLHRLLLDALDRPVVATSGNLRDEPICTDEREAVRRLGGVADLFLVHDRPIARHVDDSVVWVFEGKPRLLRRARGWAPRPVTLDEELPPILAVGAHLKNTVSLSVGRQVFVSQHIGDMETPEAVDAFERVIADFLNLYDVDPVAVVHDRHPDYVSSKWAQEWVAGEGRAWARGSSEDRRRRLAGSRLVSIQHHHAHLAACLAENSFHGPALGVTWDGTGYGGDGTVWGGEYLLGDRASSRRVAHLLPFRLPGGEAAIREPGRAALALLWEMSGDTRGWSASLPPVASFSPGERALLARMLEREVNAPVTTSAGRLFDGVAALIGLSLSTTFDGQAAMALEFAADPTVRDAYPTGLNRSERGGGAASDRPLVVDWRPLLEAVLEDRRRGVAAGIISARFHESLAEASLGVALAVGEPTVALTGGCFQNRLLLKRTVDRLRDAGFRVLIHGRVPPNDGGLGLGQIAAAAARLRAG
jgi:hydrogenase maturation protein HypF